MGSNSPDSGHPKPGGLLARLFGMGPAKPADKTTKPAADQRDEDRPATEAIPVAAPLQPATEALPVVEAVPVIADPVPMASPAFEESPALAAPAVPAEPFALGPAPESAEEDDPVALVDTVEKVEDAAPETDLEAPVPLTPVEPEAPPQLCPICGATRKRKQSYCDDCGWMFPPGSEFAAAPASPSPQQANGTRLRGRYELGQLLSERGTVSRFRGLDHGTGEGQPLPVTIVRAPAAEPAELFVEDEEIKPADDDAEEELEILPSFEETLLGGAPLARVEEDGPVWPGIAWEQALLEKTDHPALPPVIESFAEDGYEYFVEKAPEGRSLWDAWDDPELTAGERYGLLRQIAEAVQEIHRAGAIFEALRPDLIGVTDAGQVRFTDLGDLLPLPLPSDLPVRVSLYTPPELVLSSDQVDARADLYSFGAMLYALEYLHHELSESDFERQFSPKLITDRCPDVHPAFFRLISKTFVRDPNTRFPSDEAVKEDPSGFTELVRTLEVCGRAFDNVRLDIAAWTTTGMVRTGNEDAFALLHAMESRQDDLGEYALALLADGMGGYEAGEVAAAMAIQALRQNLLQQPMFAALAGGSPPPAEEFNLDDCKQLLLAALKHANREVFAASRTPGKGKRGMGCTAEAVYVDSQNVVVGHVGDSRTYHLHQGRLVQLTRDQTFVNRMVELGKLSAEEAENHPRKNELQQAIGGQPDVQPNLYHGKLERGDWVVVCSDGLSNHVPPEDLQKMLLREATSAEEAARRLLNLVNLRGATDNATVVIVRAC
jgi:serine/threonine protein phosphatase PrpC/serine/threonine protein kinase